MLRVLTTNFNFSRVIKWPTQIFDKLTNKQLATPELVRKLVKKRIPFHSRISQSGLFHGKRAKHTIRSCYSDKKTKYFQKVHKYKGKYYSDILQQNIRVNVSRKAYRTINKMGGIDNYILCTKPQKLDSKIGEFLRQIMLRKINNPNYIVPYILKSKPVQRIRKKKYTLRLRQARSLQIPRYFRENMLTFQKPFGKTPEQLSEEDYAKYIELEKLKKSLGDQLDKNHPLILELEKKMGNQMTPEQQQFLQETAVKAQQDFFNLKPKYKQELKMFHQKQVYDFENAQLKFKEALIKFKADSL